MRWPLWRIAVAERSMEPALRPGDWLLTWRGTRAGRPPRVRSGQLVIARHPGRPGLLLVKRARPGQDARWYLLTRLPSTGGCHGCPAVADQLLARIEDISKIFWETKQG